MYSIDISRPATYSRLIQRITNHYTAQWPAQFVIDLFVEHQRFVVRCPLIFETTLEKSVWHKPFYEVVKIDLGGHFFILLWSFWPFFWTSFFLSFVMMLFQKEMLLKVKLLSLLHTTHNLRYCKALEFGRCALNTFSTCMEGLLLEFSLFSMLSLFLLSWTPARTISYRPHIKASRFDGWTLWGLSSGPET